MKCYLVTGALGFIGSNLTQQLLEDGHIVIGMDDLSTGKEEHIPNHPNFVLLREDISNLDVFRYVRHGINGVFHLAALARVQRSIDDPVGTWTVNVTGSLNVIEYCRKNNIPLVNSSSSSVYGKQSTACMVETMTQLYPLSPYAEQKRTVENICSLYARTYNQTIISLRYFNVYGKNMNFDGAYPLVIAKFINQIKSGQNMTIYGEGNQTRAYTHVSDVVSANILAMNFLHEHPRFKGHEIFNIGHNIELSVKEVAFCVGDEHYKNIDFIIPNPRGDFEEDRKYANWGKAEEWLNWRPVVNPISGITDIAKYYLNVQ